MFDEYMLSLNHHASTFIGRSFSPIMDLKKKKTIFFDIKYHDSYLMKCLHNNISQNDTIC